MPTKWYLTNRTAPYTPATLRGAWDKTAGAVTKALDPSKLYGGANANVAIAETDTSTTYDVLLYRGISGPLAAQTINCNVDVVIGIRESNLAADFYWHVHLYATQGDSDTPRVTLLTDYVENTTNEYPASATFRALQSAQAVNQTVSAGDRLVLEIGYIARNSVATSYTGTLYYGTQLVDGTGMADGAAAGTDVTVKAGFISFSSEVSEQTLTASVAQMSTRTLSAGTPDAKVAQMSVRSLSAAYAATGYVAQMSVRTLSANTPPAPSYIFPALTLAG